MFDFLSLGKRIKDAGDEIRSRRRELELARQERDLIAAAPLSRDDTLKALHARIDAEGARHLKIFTGTLMQLVSKGDQTRIDGFILGAQKPGAAPTPASLEAGISLLFADQFKASVGAIVSAMQWPEGAMDHADKQKRLSELDSKIGRIESDLTALVRSARAAGISV